MFISHKSNVVLQIQETEWLCRMLTKGMDIPEYWPWLESITDSEGVPDYSGEDYEIVETEVDVNKFYISGHITSTIEGVTSYHLKWDASKKEVVTDDTAKAAWELAEEWKQIRAERTRLLAETDYLALKDNTLSTAMKEYRNKLRSVPQDNSDPYNITWPTKPS